MPLNMRGVGVGVRYTSNKGMSAPEQGIEKKKHRNHKISKIFRIWKLFCVSRFSCPAYISRLCPGVSDLYAGKLDILTE